MNGIVITTIKNQDEIEFLRGRQSFEYTYNDETIDSLKKHFDPENSLYLLAKKGSEFAAFCSIDRGWWEENIFFIREILVDQNFQKLGIGEKLMQKCIEYAKSKGTIGVVTETDFKNKPMQGLCKKLGFKEWNNPQWKNGIAYRLIF
ncbi:MAG: hypothetical protein A3J93_01815 [Candidatus Magasanikbacteria bacterium RIFOXYC2_FULL_42_28]|uniref:N-acetyltransferase domain-containing protein n=1 Tax=Candidatus Magasanikbacteria bacterium RIFOXYC2_FULL_42_28 TaxID=1798704 RepID=A0A1F6NY15_9BACT|nr:MAG: hypothetical protein A3J93_01815 [Candidatus Magasanikbacteria bacterium RIFOXYC2_FULL_42_28]